MKNLPDFLLKLALTVVILVLGFFLYNILFSPYYFELEKADRYEEVKERMRDIVQAQEAYRRIHGEYAGDFDKLILTLKSDSIRTIRTLGAESDSVYHFSRQQAIEYFQINPDLPDQTIWERIGSSVNMNNEKLAASGEETIFSYMVSDTLYEPALRTVRLSGPIDSLKYIPYSGGQTFQLKTSTLEVGAGRVRVPTYEVVAYNSQILRGQNASYFKGLEGIRLGSLREANTNIEEFRIRDTD